MHQIQQIYRIFILYLLRWISISNLSPYREQPLDHLVEARVEVRINHKRQGGGRTVRAVTGGRDEPRPDVRPALPHEGEQEVVHDCMRSKGCQCEIWIWI